MKRFLYFALGVAVIGALGWYFYSATLAAALARNALRRVVTAAAARGVDIDNASFASARFSGVDTIVCDHVLCTVRSKKGLRAAGPERFICRVDRVLVEVKGLWKGRVAISAFGGLVEMLDESSRPTGERLSQVRVQFETDVEWRHPAAAAERIENEVRRLLRESRCNLALSVDGVARFRIGTRWEEVALRARPDRAETVLSLDEDDVRRISKDYIEALTQTEITLVAKNPVRAPALLRLCEQATSAAVELHRRDKAFPTDAYRHVYWSYLLTHAFGAEFAEEVTDAHENEPTYEQGEADRKMDINNNAIGRTYALAGVQESEIAERVRRDPRVVRSAR